MSNTKVIVRGISRHIITVEILPDRRRLVISRIVFHFTMRSGLVIEWKKFPLLCYAITVNKSQGQTLNSVYRMHRCNVDMLGRKSGCYRNDRGVGLADGLLTWPGGRSSRLSFV